MRSPRSGMPGVVICSRGFSDDEETSAVQRKGDRGADGEGADNRLLVVSPEQEHSENDSGGGGGATAQAERRGQEDVDDPERQREHDTQTSVKQRARRKGSWWRRLRRRLNARWGRRFWMRLGRRFRWGLLTHPAASETTTGGCGF